MKKILILLMALSLAGFLACGNDESDGQVSMTISTEDGIENLGNIMPGDPSYDLPPAIDEWLKYIQVQVYANGKVMPRNLIMSKVVGKAALIRGDYLVMDIPSGRDLIFVVNAADSTQVIQYSGMVGPINVQPRSIVPINILLKKVNQTAAVTGIASLILNLKDYNNKELNFSETIGSPAMFNISSSEVKVNIYTQAKYVDNHWILANPPDATYENVVGTYDPGTSQHTGGPYISNMFQLITVHIVDAWDWTNGNKGVIAYGVAIFNPATMPGPIDVYMRYAARLAVSLVGTSMPVYPATVQVLFPRDGTPTWIPLNVNGTNSPTFDANVNNPILVESPTAEQWYPDTPQPIGTLYIRVTGNGSVWSSSPVPVEIDFGVSSVTVTGP